MRSSLAPSADVEALWKAAKKHDAARVKELLVRANAETGSLALVNEFYARRGSTALMAACLKRETEHKHPARSAAQTVQLLLEFGADTALRARDRDGDTALHLAAACNQVRSVEFMVTAGADVFALNAHGHSALDLARWHRSADVADVLTQAMRVHSGWLHVRVTKRDGRKALRVWKRRWGVALACDTHHRVVELALFKDRDAVCPQRVVLLRADAHELVAVAKTKWLDRHYMVGVASGSAAAPLVVQKPRARRFSRLDGAAEGTGETLELAAEGSAQREAWLGILRRSAYGLPMRPGQLSSQPWQPAQALMPVVVVGNDSPTALFGSMALAPLSPLGESDQHHYHEHHPAAMTVTPAYVSATSHVATSPRGRDAPSAPSFISSDSLRASQLSFYEPAVSTAPEAGAGRSECVICMDAPRDAICVPCGHVAGCYACLARQVQARSGCPICRAFAQTVVKIYDV